MLKHKQIYDNCYEYEYLSSMIFTVYYQTSLNQYQYHDWDQITTSNQTEKMTKMNSHQSYNLYKE